MSMQKCDSRTKSIQFFRDSLNHSLNYELRISMKPDPQSDKDFSSLR